ncbi:MAG: asparagine synthetase B [Planctomycetes bacterium]|nr:asparagine synthetase B [Planctomycetota bacterium]
MCGILGVRQDFATREQALAALGALQWRGPDGTVLREVDGLWLGVARLAITDASSTQPLEDTAARLMIAFNGAVTSARDEREWPGPPLRTGNDAELLLRRFVESGANGLLDMTGPYAAALVDAGAHAVWFAGDPIGEKPLWIVTDADRLLAFASCPAALRPLGFRVGLSPGQRARFLRYGFTSGAVLSGWPQLLGDSAPVLRSDARGLQLAELRGDAARRAPLERVPARVGSRAARPSLRLAAALQAAVVRCADAEVPAGLALSGGIDSACIAACLPRARFGRWHAFQFRATGEPDDERLRAQDVAQRFGLKLVAVDGGPELLRALPELTRLVGLPLGDPSLLAAFALARGARADGVRVLLSGEGADDLLLGYPRHRAARWLPARGLDSATLRGGLSMSRRARWRRAWFARRPYDALLEIGPPAFRAQVLAPELWRDDAGALPPSRGSALDRARFVDRELYLRLDLLPKLDTATMAAGVEGRCPFLDPEILRSREVNLGDARRVLGKRALIAAFGPRLPPGHTEQRKRGFAIPLDRWLREDDFLADVLRDARTLQRPWLVAAGLTRMLDLHRTGRARLGHALYAVAALELFDRLDEDAGSPVP